MLERRILEFGNKFKGRLEDMWLEVALDYVNYNEWGLAFETLCDYLVEYNVFISVEEYDEMIKLAKDMRLNLDNGNFKYLKYLARRNSKI